MKNSIIIANWKMNLGLKQTKSLTKEILLGLKSIKEDAKEADLVLCPSFSALTEVNKLLKSKVYHLKFSTRGGSAFGGKVFLGAQDLFWQQEGNYTGEISPTQLKEFGCKYVIIGHSERRQYLKETDEMVHKKIVAALDQGLIPIICLGETFEERQKGLKDYVIINQLTKALEGVNFRASLQMVVAYEPVWVIGSGQAVAPEEAEYTNRVIKQKLIDFFPLPVIKNNIRIIYGGSVDSRNLKGFLGQETIDGVLVGGASLKADEFVRLIEIMLYGL